MTKNSTIVSINRIQALRIKQGMLRRIIGYAEIYIEKAAMETHQNNSSKLSEGVIHPFIKKSKIDDFIQAVLPEFAGAPARENLDTLKKPSLRRAFMRMGRHAAVYLILPVAIAYYCLQKYMTEFDGIKDQLLMWMIIAVAAALVFLMITAYLNWKGKAYGYNENMLVLRAGAYGRRFVYLPRKKIQYAVKKQNPFQRRLQLATIQAFLAVPTMRSRELIDLSATKADAWLAWVESYTRERM
jgi:putative membrane protein